MESKSLNLGCGENKLDGFINVDFEEKTNPDVVCNFKKEKLPFLDDSFEIVHLLHCLEHIEVRHWNHVFSEIRRVMTMGGVLRLAYPEFEVCSKYFLENNRNMRGFWRGTLYGRQDYPGDYHVVPMVTSEVCEFLVLYGFKEIKHCPEPEEWNTFLTCKKSALPLTKEEVFRTEVFGGKVKV